MELPERITSDRLILRRPQLSDAEAVFEEYASDPAVTRFLPWAPHASVEETKSFLVKVAEGWDTAHEYTWGLTIRGTERVVGMIAIRPHGHKADMGYVLGQRHWGKGLMVEAASAVIETAFQDPAMWRVWAVCDIDNTASARVMEKAGMMREGVLRSFILHPNVSAEPRDALVYSRVRTRPGSAAMEPSC